MCDRPKIVFLIPIASSREARNWSLACSLLKQTLGSIFHSTNANFRVVVAGNEPPDFPLPDSDPRFKFLSLDPSPSKGEDYWGAAVRDKMTKISAGWEYAKQVWNPEYVMKVDWDDLISSRLVEWLASTRSEAGFRITDGWIWRPHHRRLLQHTEQFDRTCGTCLILRSDVADREGPFLHSGDGIRYDEKFQEQELRDSYGLIPGAQVSKLLLTDTHIRSEAQFAYLGHKLAPVPFSAAVYRIGHGNNASGSYNHTHTLRMWLGRIRRTRFITASLQKEFNL
jgi:hypothetical protein